MTDFAYVVNPGTAFPFVPGARAAGTLFLPVRPLFNENDSCGECVPLSGADIDYVLPDGTRGTYRFAAYENIFLSHDDIRRI